MNTVTAFRPGSARAAQNVLPLRDPEIEGVPAFRRILTAWPGHRLELPGDMQSRVALLEIEATEVVVVVEDEFQDHPEFDNLIARARGLGLVVREIIRLPYSRVQLLSQFRVSDSANNGGTATVRKDNHGDSMLRELLEYAIRERATDVHIEILDDDPAQVSVAVKLRIDGKLRRHPELCHARYAQALSDMVQILYGAKVDAGSTSDGNFSQALNQYATVTQKIADQVRTLRYQSFKIQHGNRYVLRIPDERESGSTDLAKLGYSPSHLSLLKKIVRQRYGATLVCGTVNTGKTTSMQRMVLNTPNAGELHIASIEDPIEGHNMGRKISRIAIQRGAESSRHGSNVNPFARTIRDLLRGDIDVFYMGEIRDQETASAFEAAIQTGHKGYGTLHVGSGFAVIPRLSSVEIGISRESIATPDFLTSIICQRLMPKLCPDCCHKVTEEAVLARFDDEQREAIKLLEKKFGIPLDGVRTRHVGSDCPRCKGTGTVDRILMAEVIVPDDHMYKLWREGRDSDAKEYWRKKRIRKFNDADCTGKTAYEHGLYLVSIGKVDPLDLDAIIPLSFYDIVRVEADKQQ